MTRKTKKKTSSKTGPKRKPAKTPPKRTGLRRWVRRILLALAGFIVFWITLYALIAPPTTPYIISEKMRLGDVDRQWVDLDEIAPVMARSVVAAEDANFCRHWGFDMGAIRAAIEDGGNRGASTLTQQVVKNTFLWHGRSWLRKVLEAGLTPAVELIWTKRRIVEIYLNIAEFDEGVFGVEAASRHYFGVGPEELTATQAARLAALLPNPKERSAARPSPFVRKRAQAIVDGAATIRADGRADCFED